MKTIRCAIYTRKSVEEGLEQEFNSLDAQRLACESYIKAKEFDGWTLVPKHYDDGGFSGANLNRPRFQELMNDIRSRQIDMVVCYKIDRLSRSLMDFTQVFEEFEKYEVSFACVTQEINTSTSMGRMVMNLLMTFAQFERELIAERVRDKMHSSRKKGLWTGGVVPYGYVAKDRKLIIDADKAPHVVKIFQWYSQSGSNRYVIKKLEEEGIVLDPENASNRWNVPRINRMLRNPIYNGKILLKGESYQGAHEAIIGDELWSKVKAKMTAIAHTNPDDKHAPKNSSLLFGLIKCGYCNEKLVYRYSSKNKQGTRYGYYTCWKDLNRGVPTCPLRSISAQMIEPLVEQELIKYLSTPSLTHELAKSRHCTPFEMKRTLSNPEELWRDMNSIEKRKFFQSYIDEVKVFTSSVDIKFKLNGNTKLIEEYSNEHFEN